MRGRRRLRLPNFLVKVPQSYPKSRLSTALRASMKLSAVAADAHVVCQRFILFARLASFGLEAVPRRNRIAGKADSRIQHAVDDRPFDQLVDVREKKSRDAGRHPRRAG